MAAVFDEQGKRVLGKFTGPAYPFGSEVESVLGPKQDVNVVVSSIYNILTTIKGSVPYAPTLGSSIPTLLFEPLDSVTLGLVRYFCEKDLSEQEPRIRIAGVDVAQTGDCEISAKVAFVVLGDPYRRVFNAPFTFNRSF